MQQQSQLQIAQAGRAECWDPQQTGPLSSPVFHSEEAEAQGKPCLAKVPQPQPQQLRWSNDLAPGLFSASWQPHAPSNLPFSSLATESSEHDM